MAANRKTFEAPTWLLGLSKVTLADLVWQLAKRRALDGALERAILDTAIEVHAPRSDLKKIYGGSK